MITQTDSNIKKYELAKGVTVGDYGCLVVSIFNIVTEFRRFTGKKEITFAQMLNDLKLMNAFDSDGIFNWNPTGKLLGFTHLKYTPKYFNTIRFSNDPKVFWIAEIPHYSNPKLSHFVNITAANKGIITYFDVYDGCKKQIHLQDCKSIRELVFYWCSK